jgi:hypothetical protein
MDKNYTYECNCTVCGKIMKPRKGKRFCSSTCRVKGHLTKGTPIMWQSMINDSKELYKEGKCTLEDMNAAIAVFKSMNKNSKK